MMRRLVAPFRHPIASLLLAAGLTSPAMAGAPGDSAQGERLFRAQCIGCHSLVPGEHLAGPSLHALIGRPAGSLEDFDYSPVLDDAAFAWNAETIDAFLAGPDDFLPGTRMVLWGLDERSRRRIIHFLETLEHAPSTERD